MTAADNEFGALLQDYIAECLPLAEQAADLFLELELRWDRGEPGDDMLALAAGPLHTVKGNSAMMGLAPQQTLAHALEDILAAIRTRPETRTPASAALLVEGAGVLSTLVSRAAHDTAAESETFVTRVRAWLAETSGETRGGQPERRRADRRAGAAAPSSAEGGADTVRVDFRRLDGLMEILGEALIQHSALADVYRRLKGCVGAGPELGDLDRAIVSLEQTLRRLEAGVMETRLLPLSTVFGKLPRLLREVAQREQKRVRLVTTGGETPLDKTILDRLGEPLLHILTNAVVHGIECPEARVGAGKSAEGLLELRAEAASGRVVITFSDDGRGLDPGKIRAKAVSLGLEVQEADEEHLVALVFQPGFSTAEAVSGLAGRGVGLDVVARSIHALSGTIELRNTPGRGVAFTLSLPLTLAIVRSLIIEVDEERFVVPMSHVAETVRVESDSIHEINRKGVAAWRGNLLHVADGGTLLGTRRAAAPARRFCLVLTAGSRRRGLLVDRVVGHQEVVVKGLDTTLGTPDLVSGTTVLGDGRVACILDAGRILELKAS